MPIGIGKREQLGGKEDSRLLGLSGWLLINWYSESAKSLFSLETKILQF